MGDFHLFSGLQSFYKHYDGTDGLFNMKCHHVYPIGHL